MMVMTAKVNMKKIALILGAIAAGIIGIILLFGGSDAQTTSAPAAANNDARVKFLQSFGWEVATSPEESSQVRIPETSTEVFDRYNQLQKSQGYDLSKLAGKNAMSTKWRITPAPQNRFMPRFWSIKTRSWAVTSRIPPPTEKSRASKKPPLQLTAPHPPKPHLLPNTLS